MLTDKTPEEDIMPDNSTSKRNRDYFIQLRGCCWLRKRDEHSGNLGSALLL